MSAEWAAVIVAAAGLGYAVFRHGLKWFAARRSAARARLQLVTSRWAPNGLRLQLSYTPEFLHSALRMQVTIKTPGVRLIAGRPALYPAPMVTGGYIRWEFDGQCIEGSGVVKLMPSDRADTLTGVMFLLPDGSSDWILRDAKIEVSVHDGDRRALLKRAYAVSAIGEDPHAVFAVPPSLHPIVLE